MRSVEELNKELADVREFCKALNDQVIELRRQLSPYWFEVAKHRQSIWSSLRTKENPETGKPMLLGYEGERVRVLSEHWIGPAKGGCSEACERDVIKVECRKFRREIFDRWSALHEEWRPLLAEHRTIKADLDAGLRLMNALHKEIEAAHRKRQKNTGKVSVNEQLRLWSE